MALSPLDPIIDDIEFESVTEEESRFVQPTKTYAIDFETGEIGGIVDGEEAIRQFIRKAIITERFRYLIYDDQYGCELPDLIGQNVPFPLLEAEVPRMITEALLQDDRIEDVRDFVIAREEDKLSVTFTVELTDGNTLAAAEEVRL